MNKSYQIILSVVITGVIILSSSLKIEAKLRIGTKAPEFSLPDETGTLHSLHSLIQQGKRVALSFYPKDDSPHCTKEMCSLRDGYEQLAHHDIIVVGISYDSAQSHASFKKKHSLPFLLLTDTDKRVTKLYNATGSWYTFGLMPKRITYLINTQGTIVHIIKKVDSKHHAQQILDVFSEI